MNKLNAIGLSNEDSNEVAVDLDVLLSSYQVLYMNIRGFHWNIKGENFFQMHLKFEELYNEALNRIDEIAERILTLGEVPSHTFSEYIGKSKVEESKNISDGKRAIILIVNDYQTLLDIERIILIKAQGINDEGTVSLLTDYIMKQEKDIWMFNSYLN